MTQLLTLEQLNELKALANVEHCSCCTMQEVQEAFSALPALIAMAEKAIRYDAALNKVVELLTRSQPPKLVDAWDAEKLARKALKGEPI